MRRVPLHIVILFYAAATASAQESSYDHDVLRTKTGDTLKDGALRTTFEFEYMKNVDGAKVLFAPRVLAHYGLSDWAQVGIQFDARTIDGGGDFPSSGYQAGDPYLTARVMPWEAESWLFGADVAVKIPSADNSKGAGTDEGDVAIRGIIHRRFDDWRVTINAGMAAQGDNTSLAQVDGLFLWGVATEYVVDDSWRLMGEMTGALGGEPTRNLSLRGENGRGQVRGRLGVVYVVNNEWSLGLAGEGGVTAQTPDYDVLVSISRFWGTCCEHAPSNRAVSKSRWNPAPVYLERLNVLDTIVAQTVAEGRGLAFWTFGAREQADNTHLFTAPRIGATFGLGADADASVSIDHRILSGNSKAAAFRDGAGLGDLWLRLRWVPIEYENFRGGLGVGGKIPLHESGGLSTGEVDVELKALLTWLFDHGRLHMNFGYAIEGDPLMLGEQNDFLVYSVAGEVEIIDELTFLSEISGSAMSSRVLNVGMGANGQSVLEGRVGFLGPITDGWNWTAAASKGFNNQTPDWDLQIGIGTEFGD